MKKAFTLIELMIVVTIIGILVAISVTSFTNAQRRSRDVARKGQVLGIQSALEQYRSVNNTYAPAYGLAKGYTGDGLGNCFYNINDTVVNDPMFVQDTSNATTTALTPYLAPLVAAPRAIGSSLPIGFGSFSRACNAGGPNFAAGTINYRAQNKYYMLRVALEYRNQPADPSNNCNSGTPGNLAAADGSNTLWKQGSYPVTGAVCTTYKIYQRSSTPNL